MKRITYWPQAWLGIAMNFGIVIAWVAITNEVNMALHTALMVGTWGWTMHYGNRSFICVIESVQLTRRRHDLRLPGSQG
jgi:4-hydroxybenzoate polyprenyltransferase